MRLLVTGAHGMLGKAVTDVFSPAYELDTPCVGEMDIRYPDMVMTKLKRFKPDIVVHLAALTDVDHCEIDSDQAIRTNVMGTLNITRACEAIGARVLLVSSIAVFSGSKQSPYTEFDAPSPRSVYGKTKHHSEQIVMRSSRSNCVVRTGWLFGCDEKDNKFVGLILNRAKSQSTIPVVCDTFGSPTYTIDLAMAMRLLIENRCSGIYHVVNSGDYCTRFQLAEKILEYANIHNVRLFPVSSDYFQLKAPRPRMEASLCLRLMQETGYQLTHWAISLENYLRSTDSSSSKILDELES